MRTIALAGAFTLLFGCGGGTAITPAAPFPAFDRAVNLGPPVNSQDFDGGPNISADGLDLYFCSNRPGGYGGDDVWVATRTTGLSRFDPPANLGPTVNSPANDCDPSISKDDRVLLIASDRKGGKGGLDIWVATRSSRSQPFGKPVNLGATVNSGFSDRRPDISAVGLT